MQLRETDDVSNNAYDVSCNLMAWTTRSDQLEVGSAIEPDLDLLESGFKQVGLNQVLTGRTRLVKLTNQFRAL